MTEADEKIRNAQHKDVMKVLAINMFLAALTLVILIMVAHKVFKS